MTCISQIKHNSAGARAAGKDVVVQALAVVMRFDDGKSQTATACRTQHFRGNRAFEFPWVAPISAAPRAIRGERTRDRLAADGLELTTLWRFGLRRSPTLFNFIQTSFREWAHVEQPWTMHRPLVDLPGARPPGAMELYCSPGVAWRRSAIGGTEVSTSCDGSVSPMSAVYPAHLQKEIDRRWLQRSEEAVSVRVRRSAGVSQERSNGVSDVDLRLGRRFGTHWRSERGWHVG
jgi:hypothetical protein